MKSGFLFVWLATLTLLTTTCQAQPSRGGIRNPARSSRDTLFRLLEMPLVRQEIALRPLQIEMLDDLQADLSEQRRAAFSTNNPLDIPGARGGGESNDGARDRFEAIRAAVQKIRLESEKLVTVILDAKQSTRLNQLRLQDEGTRALDRQELRDQLGVSEEQFKKIKEVRRTEDDPSLSRRRRQRKLDEVVLAQLDPEQQVKFKELQGESFVFPLPLPADLRGLRDPDDGNRPRRPQN